MSGELDENDDQIVTGTCTQMCPLAEVKLHQKEGLLHPFEMISGTEKNRRPRPHMKRVVKSYRRCAAGRMDPEPKYLRPLPVLVETVNFLLENVATRVDVSWVEVYDYVFDRLRAVRQDAVIQRCSGRGMQYILEKIIQFHIYAGYRLCEEPTSRYDAKINETHTLECLKRLLRMYEDEDDLVGRRAEFEAVYIIYNLGSTEALTHCLQLDLLLRSDDNIHLAWSINMAYLQANYVRMFRLAQHLNPTSTCALHQHIHNIQKSALQRMCHGFHSKNLRYPIVNLVKLLNFNSVADAMEACRCCGLAVSNDDDEKSVSFVKGDFKIDADLKARNWSQFEKRLEEKEEQTETFMRPIFVR